MKRGGPDHPKLRRLSVLLHKPRYQVVGLMESLYHFAATYAKRGDLGKWTNEEIAAGVEWEGDADELVQSLVEVHLLDTDPTYRLLIHDWAEHSDQTVHRSEEVKTLGFASAQLADASKHLAGRMSTRERVVFIPPIFQEVRDYCTERKNRVDPEAFIDHYTSNGWMVGKTKMKNWRAAVRTWERNDFGGKAATPADGKLRSGNYAPIESIVCGPDDSEI